MKVMISYPPFPGAKGVAQVGQNRQFQWFKDPTYIYPVVPATAATLLRDHDFQVIWNDGIAGGWTYDRFLEHVRAEKPDVMVFETKTPVVKIHWRIISDLKKLAKRDWHPVVIMMGDHVTALPKESMEQSPVDYIITGGDYDFLLLNVCSHIREKREGRKEITLEPGIWFRRKGEPVNSGPFVLSHGLDELPFIDRTLTRWELYSQKNGNFKYLPGTYIMSARDCWHHRCTFCSWTTLYPGYRVRSPEKVLDEIGMLIDTLKVKEIMDDSGTLPVGEWLRVFCRGMIERKYNEKVILNCNMRFGALSLNEYKLMAGAGFRFVLFGLESANQATLDRLQKNLTVRQIIDSCRDASRAGLSPHLTVMFGYPWETPSEIRNTVELGRYLMKKGFAQTLQSTIVVPYPGTPFFEECRKNGWLLTRDWTDFDMSRAVMRTDTSSSGEMKKAVQKLYRVAFSPAFLTRKLMSIRKIDDIKFFMRAGRAVFGHLMDFNR